MNETKDKEAGMGGWNPVNPRGTALISSYLNDRFVPRPFCHPLAQGHEDQRDNDDDDDDDDDYADHGFQFSGVPLVPHSNNWSKSGLSERKAKAGFSKLTIDTAYFRSRNMEATSSDMPSQFMMIPSGLSPATLLESPVFISNAMAQTSPTTGKLQFELFNNTNSDTAVGIPLEDVTESFDFKPSLESTSSIIRGVENIAQTSTTTGKLQFEQFNNTNSDTAVGIPLEDVTESFAFKPSLESTSSIVRGVENKATVSIKHSLSPPYGEVLLTELEEPGFDLKNQQSFDLKNQQGFRFHTGFSDLGARKDITEDSAVNQCMSNSFVGDNHVSPPEEQHYVTADHKEEFSSVAVGAPQDDGYNWRKYGQKQVKGSEYPRSYYKCTHPNCQVKKKVERSQEGYITEIIYKGNHCHPMPPPNRRFGPAHSFGDVLLDGSEHRGTQTSYDGKVLCNSDGPYRTSSAPVPGDHYVGLSAPMAVHDGSRFESADVVDVSTTVSNDEEDDDRATHGSEYLGDEGEGDESESKRRKLDAAAMEMSAALRAVREPRVVVQTTSEIDILDDGYRWRKYGQKVVKGNPNPRSYYKCTNPGCTVRKHVERASHDLKAVITTYEGKHNHDVPVARNSGHAGSGSVSTSVSSSSQSHNLHKRQYPVHHQDSLMRFVPPAQFGAFGLTGMEMQQQQQLGPPDFLFVMGQPGLTNLPIPGLTPMAPLKMPALPPLHLYPNHHHSPYIAGGFMVPKGEIDEAMLESRLPATNGPSIYHQAMGRFS